MKLNLSRLLSIFFISFEHLLANEQTLCPTSGIPTLDLNVDLPRKDDVGVESKSPSNRYSNTIRLGEAHYLIENVCLKPLSEGGIQFFYKKKGRRQDFFTVGQSCK